MDDRASLPVSLPREDPTISYWQDPPDPELANYVSSDLLPEEFVETVIIGSGITGTCTAWNLLGGRRDEGALLLRQRQRRQHGRVVMLEAREACSGATGRNGGHTKAGSYRGFLDFSEKLGIAQAVKIAKLEYANMQAVHAFAREHGIACDSWQGDTVDVIYDQTIWEESLKAVRAMRDAMPDELEGVARYKVWSAEEARERLWVKGEPCVGAISYAAGSLSAYKFVIGLLKMCVEAGLRLFTNTAATKVERGADGVWKVETRRGIVRANRVVMATNGYTGYLSEKFRKVIVPLRGQITAHRPGKNMPVEGLKTTYSFIYSNGYEYMISRPPGSKYAGDIIIGGGLVKAQNEGLEEFGNTDDTSLNREISSYLTESTKRYFGDGWGDDAKEGRIRKEWTGIMGYSPDGLPFVGEVPGERDLWIAASFQGHGMVLCFMCAKALVSMMEPVATADVLEEWFPNTFRISEERMGKRFVGRLHTKVEDRKA